MPAPIDWMGHMSGSFNAIAAVHERSTMKNPFVKDWLGRIREDLRAGDSEQLALHVEQAGLDLLLDPEFLEEARRTDARQVVVLVASLGMANTEQPAQYQRLLAAYQCLLGQQSVQEAAKSCADAVAGQMAYYKALLTAMVDKKSDLPVARTPASADDLLFGMQMMVDAQCSAHVLPLFKAWKSIDNTDKPWLMAIRVLVQRLQHRHTVGESVQLAHTLDALLAQQPASQKEVGKTVLQELVKVALYAKLGDLSFKAAEQLLAISPGLEERFFFIRALMLQGKLGQASERADELLCDMAKNPTAFTFDAAEERGEFNIGQAIDTLKTVNAALQAKGLQPFLMSGTLLGYERNRSLLPHDKDLDMGLIGWEHQFTVMQTLLELGHFDVDLSELTGHKRYLISAVDLRNGIAVDFFLFHDAGDHFRHGIDFDYGFTENFKFSKFELNQVDFLGEQFFVPSDIDRNLSENYGDWRTPEKNYVVTVEAPAIIGRGSQTHQLIAKLELMKTICQRMPVARGDRIMKHLQAQGIEALSASTRQALEAWIEKGSVSKSKRLTDLLSRLKAASKPVPQAAGKNDAATARKVLLVGHSFGHDGAAMMLKKTARYWANELNWQVHGYAPGAEHQDALQAFGIQSVRSWDEHDYDLVLVNSLLVGDVVFKLPPDVPKVLWVHEGETVVRNARTTVGQWMHMFEAYDGVIFQSRWQTDSVYRSFIHRMPQSKVHVVPNGIDWPYPTRAAQSRQNRASGQPFKMVCVASMTGRKRPQDLAQAVMTLSEQMAIECTFIGDLSRLDTLPNEFQSLIHAGGHPSLKLVGAKSQAEIHQELADADAFCLPSGDESYPLSPLEAALTDVPVILTDLAPYASIGWAHGDNCLIYKTGDVQALVQQIQALAADPALGLRLARSARMLAQQMPFDAFSQTMTQVLGTHMRATAHEADMLNA